ncbi:helix-turn-helix domain-containing protein [Rhizobacter sp. P5_C2]
MVTVPDLSRHEVFDVLAHSRAQLLRSATLGDGLAVAVWRNAADATRYSRPSHHTLSLYLSGGQGTWRREVPDLRGEPGRLCVMPAGHESRWVVGGEQSFVHLYFDEAQLAPLAVRLLDREPREVQVPDLTFVGDTRVAGPLHALAMLDWQDPQARLQANALGHEALAALLIAHATRGHRTPPRGGLSAHVRRRLVDWAEARLDQPVTIGEMAAMAALSEHHFARMFRTSFGIAPHAWVLWLRIERAKQLLRHSDAPLDEVARQCGLASASHLVNRFRARTGVTPGQYRQFGK